MSKKQLINTTLIVIFCLSGEIIFAQEEKPFSYYEVIEKRNFFRPKQKEEEKVQKVKEKTTEEKETPGFILTGIVNLKGKLKAIIEKSSGEGFYVEEGEYVEDFIVEEITPNKVVLRKGESPIILRLKKSKLESISLTPKKEEASPPKKTLTPPEYKPNLIQKIRTGKIKKEENNEP
ncbi:MAG: hypothetical protein DRP61_02040 [Candidatus Omnitrophota bacterium]|nr:MAG: hypothetical protein DRP61_02040 [Candidatus Omnitrophota bacterium]RKY33619.1 MAG: hypothetical protein DRP69_06120 [Candidatus Omnitrophota bacterium]RKY42477.1 MAG: hypothetical protein DRP80_06760 [Candidatus Omnitrophota bacterium]